MHLTGGTRGPSRIFCKRFFSRSNKKKTAHGEGRGLKPDKTVNMQPMSRHSLVEGCFNLLHSEFTVKKLNN